MASLPTRKFSFYSVFTCLQLLVLFVISVSCDIVVALDEVIPLNKPNFNTDLQQPDLKQWTTYTPGDVRCYCNLPACVGTGYMCKSEQGGCFADLKGRISDVLNARHGCLELLEDSELKTQCQSEPNTGGWSKPSHPRSVLLCCFKDMCNHIDSPEARNKLNDTLMSAGLNGSEGNAVPHAVDPTPSYSNAEVWFKAATIAVPICGALILLMLIGLAVKILRSDANKLGGNYPSSMEYKSNVPHFDSTHSSPTCVNVKKVPLLYQEPKTLSSCGNDNTIAPLLVQNPTRNYEHKNEVFAKLNAVKNINMPSALPHAKLYDKPTVPLSQ